MAAGRRRVASAAAACGGGAVAAAVEQGGRGAGRRDTQEGQAGPGRARGGTGGRAVALCDGERRRLARTRRRSDVPEAATAESEGEKVGEEEEMARNLTVHSNQAKEVREREFDEKGGAPATAMAAGGGLDVDLAVERLKRAQERAPWMRGEAVQLGARGIEAERQGWSARRPAMALLELGSTRARGRRRGREREVSRLVSG